MDDWELVEVERREFADLLASLEPGEWDTPSLCEGWTVRDVAGHVVSLAETNVWGMAPWFARAGLRVDRALALLARARGRAPASDLVAALRSRAASRVRIPGVRAAGVWTDVLVHGQDARRPLGRPRAIPTDRLRRALDEAARTRLALGATRRIRGLRLEAPDADWSHGDGPVVRGPGEALLMAVCGRRAALDDLAGDGVAVLRTRR